jgi:SHS2 domain-containing protein
MKVLWRSFIITPRNRHLKYGILLRRMKAEFGFREHAHTADWELEVWAPDLPTLLEQAAHGMYTISGTKLSSQPKKERWLTLQANDAEGLLVRFLSELLWLEQAEGLGFDQFSIHVDDKLNMQAEMHGAPIICLDKEIKAVTYHNLRVESKPQGMHVNIVFDV